MHRKILLYFAVFLICFSLWGFWDLAIYKANWQMYPMPFEVTYLPRHIAADLFVTTTLIGMFILIYWREKRR